MYGLDVPESNSETLPRVMANGRAKILWDFQIKQTNR